MRIDEIKKYQISNRQLFFIIINICVGTGILSLPRTISKVSRQDSWLSIIIGGFLWMIAIFIMYKLAKRFPNDTIIQYNDKILGSYLGKILSLIFIIYGVLTTAIITRLFITVLTTFVLPKTPIWITTAILLLTSYNLVSHGLKTLARLYEFLFFILSPAFLLILPIFTRAELLNFQPFLGTGFMNIIEGSYITMFSYIGPEIILLIFPFIKEKNKALKSSTLGLGVVTLTYLFIVTASIGFYGVETLQFISWPTINLLKAVRIPFFGRLEFVFMFIWIAIAFTTISSYFFMSSYGLTQLLHWEDQRYAAFILLPFIAEVAIIPKNILQVFDYTSLIATIGVLLFFTTPLLLLIIAKLRGIKGER
ncbi:MULTISPECIES: GerAB/ArcD/ProY family transporter [unclassified Candidatus Frackibacter]|uniref:GerAB/ArcD/ProY family transporter n=1 Tax=unclassified Candidatus Frackibacter TaxID=2648818 RepID=UPI0007954D1A|nr:MULTISPECIES: GerAB/ArcD/ProY family transporter [unclassified Candidatus Frackibacter]KXS40371.1 MAG: spore germination protein [Candidatus Frackibacter sp. T328-2]SDC68261.1 spore germination protein (amino acid permease) [Candidatus Frackibacter sp. WG11]SEM83408.1 spore germination protein (amino acid permease) [Candidatus Frackibacter sp. WG12]SFL91862.1 spore germination protein (amino acid permease) [Candidatus Frackibacter sp. WG13]